MPMFISKKQKRSNNKPIGHISTPKVVILYPLLFFILSLNAKAQECRSYFNPTDKTYRVTNEHNEVVNHDLVQPKSWAANLASLALRGHLISQSDAKLATMNLLVDGGGLCGPTCIAYISASVDFHTSNKDSTYWAYHLDKLIDILLREYQLVALSNNHFTAEDPRHGTSIDLFTSVYYKNIKNHGLNGKSILSTDPNFLNQTLTGSNGIIVGTVRFVKKTSIEHPVHAVILLAINPIKKLVVILDPNLPSKLLISSYAIYGGKMYFELNKDLYGDEGSNQAYLVSAALFTLLD